MAEGLIRFLVVAVLIAIAGLVVFADVDSGAAATITGLMVLAVIAAFAPVKDLRALIENLKSLSVGPKGVAAEFYAQAREAGAVEIDEQQDQVESDRPSDNSLARLRLLLEAKLAYIAKDLLEDRPTFVTIGSLRYDGFLDDVTASVADDILTLRDEDIQSLDAPRRVELLESAGEVVRTIRARVLHGWMREILEDAEAWGYQAVPRENRLSDFLATCGNDQVLLAAAFTTMPDSAILRGAVDRLKRASPQGTTRRVVVVPRKARKAALDPGADPAVIPIHELSAELERLRANR